MANVNQKVLRFFSALSDETRLKILLGLVEKPKTVGQIHQCIGKEKMTLSAVSHQLKQLASSDIVTYVKKGREKLFSLSDNFCWCILEDAMNHFSGKEKCMECCKILKKKKRES